MRRMSSTQDTDDLLDDISQQALHHMLYSAPPPPNYEPPTPPQVHCKFCNTHDDLRGCSYCTNTVCDVHRECLPRWTEDDLLTLQCANPTCTRGRWCFGIFCCYLCEGNVPDGQQAGAPTHTDICNADAEREIMTRSSTEEYIHFLEICPECYKPPNAYSD